MNSTIIYYQNVSFPHLYVQLNVVVLADDFFRSRITITAEFHESPEHSLTELFTVGNID